MKEINIGLIGFGNVGQGFIRVLYKSIGKIKSELNVKLVLKYIIDPVKGSVYGEELNLSRILNLIDVKGDIWDYPGDRSLVALNPIEDKEIDLIIEVTPTNLRNGEPGYTHIRKSLENGKHVITTNKGPIALYYSELTAYASKRNLYLGYEGTVMSGTPLIKLLQENLKMANVKHIRGVLNGTTNFILTHMKKGMGFSEALKEAQIMGYAEADPTMDIDGYDLLAKATILVNLLSENHVKPEQIDRISLKEYLDINGFNHNLKYIIDLDLENKKYIVSPKILNDEDILNTLNGIENGVEIDTTYLGRIFIKGPGAGGIETGYAILSDLVDLIKHSK